MAHLGEIWGLSPTGNQGVALAGPDGVWPRWLVHPKGDRLLANRWVFGVKRRFPARANRLLPEYQNVPVGDLICDGPDYASYFRVQHVDPPPALVYPFDPTPPTRKPD